MKSSLLGFGFDFRVQLQQLRVRDSFAMGSKDWVKSRKDSGLPVDESAVAVEGQELELGEIEHRTSSQRSPSALSVVGPRSENAVMQLFRIRFIQSAHVFLHALHSFTLRDWVMEIEGNDLLDSFELQGLLQFKAEGRFCGQDDILVAGESGAAGACTATSERANSGTFASAGQATDECTKTCAAAGQNSRAFALALLSPDERSCRNSLFRTIDRDRVQSQLQGSTTLKAAERFCVDHSTGSSRTCRYRGSAVDIDRAGHST